MEVEVFGPNKPAAGHFFNVLLLWAHGCINVSHPAGAVSYPGRRTLRPSQWLGWQGFFSLPFIASALYIVHPLHVECVANIKGRDEILALLGGLGALWATLKYFDTKAWWWLGVSSISLLLGMFAKENALTFVAVIPLTVWVFTKVPFSRALTAAAPLLGAALVFYLGALCGAGLFAQSR